MAADGTLKRISEEWFGNPARQIRLAGNAGILCHHKHLRICHIGLCPRIIVLAPGHRKAVPDTVNIAGLQLLIVAGYQIKQRNADFWPSLPPA